MIDQAAREKLCANWGVKADSMACYAEVRVFDPLSAWCCYIYAMNPENNDEILCIVNGYCPEVTEMQLSELELMYNADGEPLEVDKEYRPRQASQIMKQLNRGSSQ